jgi:hypothetical protein
VKVLAFNPDLEWAFDKLTNLMNTVYYTSKDGVPVKKNPQKMPDLWHATQNSNKGNGWCLPGFRIGSEAQFPISGFGEPEEVPQQKLYWTQIMRDVSEWVQSRT